MTTQKAEFAFRTTTDVTLTKVNLHKVFHGPDPVQAVELNMAVDLPNTALDVMMPGLRQALYWNAEAEQGQSQIDGVEQALPNLRFPRLNDGHFVLGDKKKEKLAGYELEVEYGLNDERSKMVFDCCKVAKRCIEAKEGGTIHLTFQVQYNGDRLDKDTCGKLALLGQDLIAIRLIPPAVEQVEEASEPMENPFPVQDADDPPLTAEDIFARGPSVDDVAAEQDAVLESDAR
jgi:hypothetical protein